VTISQIQPQNLLAELSQIGKTSNTRSVSTASATSAVRDPEPQLSAASTFLNKLQSMQQQNPTQFKKVTQSIATRLQSAAQAAAKAGSSSNANALTKLASDFQSACQTGQMPSTDQLQTDASGLAHQHGYGAAASTTNPLAALLGSI
jgi:hypothetical protein